MIKKQTGFQVAIFDIPEQYSEMRESIQHLQKSGWEVISSENLAVAKDQDTGRDVERLSVTLVKYEWVEESLSAKEKAAIKKAKTAATKAKNAAAKAKKQESE